MLGLTAAPKVGLTLVRQRARRKALGRLDAALPDLGRYLKLAHGS